MKLVLATPLYPPEPGGPATYAKLLVDMLPAQGIEVVLVPFSKVRGYPRLVRHFLYERLLSKELKGADALLALDPVSVGLPALQAAKRSKKPLYVKVVGDYAWEQGVQRFGISSPLDQFLREKQTHPAVRLLQRLQSKVACEAVRVIVPSGYLKAVVATWGVPPERIVVVRNAVSVEEIGSVPEAVRALPRPLVVTAGRLVPWKGIDGVIDAVEGASLAVLGDGPERASLEERARAKQGFSYTFTGVLSHPDLLATLSQADLFVLNSTYEGLSHLLLEAVALGVPTLASDAGGNREALEGVSYAKLFPLNNPAALKTAIAQMLAHPPERAVPADDVARLVRETVLALRSV